MSRRRPSVSLALFALAVGIFASPPPTTSLSRERVGVRAPADGDAAVPVPVPERASPSAPAPSPAPAPAALFRAFERDGRLVVCEHAAPEREIALPGAAASPGEVRWSPDGTRLAVALRLAGKRAVDIYLLDLRDLDTVRLYQLTSSGAAGMPRWIGRDGRRLLYAEATPGSDGPARVLIRDELGLGEERPLFDEDADLEDSADVSIEPSLIL